MISVRNLSFSYDGKKDIIKDLSLDLNRGEILGLMAPSGYGKSTLGRLIGGYMKRDSGEILIDGEDIEKLSGFLPVQMVHQSPEKNVNPNWKAGKILNEGLEVSSDIRDILGIKEEFLGKFPAELSGGELQRICIGRCLGPDTRYLIADEITTMLDPISQAEIYKNLIRLSRDKSIGIIFISHSRALVENIGDRIIDLDLINKI